MTGGPRPLSAAAVIPARNEQNSVAGVVASLRALRRADGVPLLNVVVVCDNGSTDDTANAALGAGAIVVSQPIAGYGRACLAALAALPLVETVLFIDADGQFVAAEAPILLAALEDGADLVIGSRVLGTAAVHALTLPQRFGNWLATLLIRWLWGAQFTDLGPYRAIRSDALARLGMRDLAFGWTVEMQVKAVQLGLVWRETPVTTLRRVGRSKITGTAKGVVAAGAGILGKIVELRLSEGPWFEVPRVRGRPLAPES